MHKKVNLDMYLDDIIVYQESHPNTRQSSLQAIFALWA